MARTISLKNALLSAYSSEDLKKTAEEMHLDAGNDALSAASAIADQLLDEDYFRDRLFLMSEEDVQFFRQAVAAGHDFTPAPSQYREADNLLDAGYCFTIADSQRFIVPSDAAELFRKTDTPQFRKQEIRISWVVRCMRVVAIICQVLPAEDFEKYFRRKREYRSFTYEEIWPLIQKAASIPDAPCVLKDHFVIGSQTVENDAWKKIKNSQSDDPAAIPSYTEIMDLSTYGWAVHEKQWQAFWHYLLSTLSFSDDYADLICQVTYMDLAVERSFHQMLEDLKEYDVEIKDEDQKQMEALLQECYEVTRLVRCHGQKHFETKEYQSMLMQNYGWKGIKG